MENARPQTTETSAADKRDYNHLITTLVDAITARVQAGEAVRALDYPEVDRPLFWSAIAEQHVDGVRVRQRMFQICPRQRGDIDGALAGWIALALTCAVLLIGGQL